MADAHNVAVHAMFIMEGLHDAGYDDVIAAWDNGVIELMIGLSDYALEIDTILGRIRQYEHIDDIEYPGVFDYEVSSAFGKWLGDFIKEHGDTPPFDTGAALLQGYIRRFFLQRGENQKHHLFIDGAIRGDWL